jgi:iron complex outermembrane receptor protein
MKCQKIAFVSAVLFAIPLTVSAEDEPAEKATRVLDNIVVTAQRREEDNQTVPVSVSAFGEEQLSKLSIDRTEDIQAYVPNFSLTRGTSNPSTLNVSLRGVSERSGGFFTSESPIAFYSNDVYQGRLSGTNMEFIDIERVEVLRGPQGTLFGRNSTAGAVNIISRTPGNELYIDASASYGSYDETKIKAVVGGPIVSDKVAASLSVVSAEQGDGYKDNVATSTDQDKLSLDAIRVALNWIGSDSFEAGLLGQFSDATNDGYVPTAIDPVSLVPLTGDYFKVQTPVPSFGDTKNSSLTGRFLWDIGDVTLKSISGYSKVDDDFRFDLSGGLKLIDGSYVSGFDRTSNSAQDQFSQDIQLLSNLDDGSFNWLIGLYYFTESVEQSLADVLWLGFPATLPLKSYEASTDSYGVYGQLSWQATDRLSSTLGLRYTEEDKDIKGTIGSDAYANETSYSAFTPKLSIEYEYSDDVYFFGSYSRGFKAGGFDGSSSNIVATSTPFGEETVNSFEIGAKTEWFDRTLRVNVTIFYTQYMDLQSGVIIPETLDIVTENAFDVDQVGLELELTAAPTDRLEVFATVGLQDGDFKNFKEGSVIALSNPSRQAGISNEQATVGFSYTLPLRITGGSLRFGADVAYRDPYFSSPSNNLVSKTSELVRLNASISHLSASESWEVKLAGRNITDEVDWHGGVDLTASSLGTANRIALEPQWWTLSLRYRY